MPNQGLSLALGLVILASGNLCAGDKRPGKPAASVSPALQAGISETYGKLPLAFEANVGQADPSVKFLARGQGYTLLLTATEAVLAPHWQAGKTHQQAEGRDKRTVVRMRLVGANSRARVVGLDELPGKSNYFVGSDPSKWRTNVATYGRVRCENVYPGVDLVYYANRRDLEYDIVVRPGADPKAILFAFDGRHGIGVDSRGDIRLETPEGTLRLHRPVAYQERDGQRREILAEYVLMEHRKVSVRLAAYDSRVPLVLDPVLSFSTYLGGSGTDTGNGVAVDGVGNVYVVGATDSTNFPLASPWQSTFSGYNCTSGLVCTDVFLAKFSPTGSLLYSSYLGGTGQDRGNGIAVDGSGNVYLTGGTGSSDFPTANAFQARFGGAILDAFVAKLNASGSALLYSTYLGGTGVDEGSQIALDSSGNAYVTGYTGSSNFPVARSLQPALGGSLDAFVTKLSASGSAVVYSTFLGGSGTDRAYGIAVDSAGAAYVVGDTTSEDFPASNPFQVLTASNNGFIGKIDPTGSRTVFSIYIGGRVGDTSVKAIGLDQNGAAYVTGFTRDSDFPTTAGALKTSLTGDYFNVFATKLDSSGNVLFSTFAGAGIGFAITVDGSGFVYLTGGALDIPILNAIQAAFGGGQEDAFVMKLNAAGSALVYSTYLGGSGFDRALGVAIDSSRNVYLTGSTISTNFPVAAPFQPAYGGSEPGDAFVVRIAEPVVAPTLPPNSIVNAASFRLATDADGAVTPGAIVAVFGPDLSGDVQAALTVPLPTTLSSTGLTFNGIPAPLFFVSPTQINAQVPFDAPLGNLTVQVTRAGLTSAPQQVTVAAFSPGIFTINQQGSGAGAVLHANTLQFVSASAPAQRGEFLSIFCTGLGRLNQTVASGTAPPVPTPETLSKPVVNIANIPASVTYSGLAPGFVGLYQVNVQVPLGTPSGTQPVQIIIQGIPSNTVTIPVQ